APDLPGMGGSPPLDAPYRLQRVADLLAGACAWLGAGPVCVVGHSFGGALAVELAARRGEAGRAPLPAPPGRLLPALPQRAASLRAALRAPLRWRPRWERLAAKRRRVRRAVLVSLTPDAGELSPDDALCLLRGAARTTQLREALSATVRADVRRQAARLTL